uniref:DUF2116 family Zn-ribbon domain-containing protein n=1 Tax=Geoglobus ahangari TaxID=113653 RepID=A0A7C4WJ93_9EURY
MPGIVPHRHCIVCGKAIEPEEILCSKECREKFEKEKKKQRNFMIIMFAVLIALFILMIFSG